MRRSTSASSGSRSPACTAGWAWPWRPATMSTRRGREPGGPPTQYASSRPTERAEPAHMARVKAGSFERVNDALANLAEGEMEQEADAGQRGRIAARPGRQDGGARLSSLLRLRIRGHNHLTIDYLFPAC